mgnify:CR=1 FL=1
MNDSYMPNIPNQIIELDEYPTKVKKQAMILSPSRYSGVSSEISTNRAARKKSRNKTRAGGGFRVFNSL